MIVVGWSQGTPNNNTGSGYGVRMARGDRDAHFRKSWPFVSIELGRGNTVEVNLSGAFWRGCTELRSAKIGKWLLDKGLAPWPKGNPPKLQLKPIADKKFKLS